MPKRHKWEPAPTKARADRERCARKDCDLFRYTHVSGNGWTRYDYKRGRRWTLYGSLGEGTPPCGPMTESEKEWLS